MMKISMSPLVMADVWCSIARTSSELPCSAKNSMVVVCYSFESNGLDLVPVVGKTGNRLDIVLNFALSLR
jgi:hypothetical protein